MARRLFEPVRLGPVSLRNRTIRAAAFEGMAPRHEVSDELVDYHRRVAAGGVGLSTVAYAAVQRSGLAFPHQLWLRPDAVPGLRRLVDAIHAGGARASIQLGHCGNMAKSSLIGGRPLAPSARPNLYGPTWPRAMDDRDIRTTIAAYGDAVRVARDAGFDAVEVHAGHGYLISQFLSPYTNRRRDAWGGPFERRARFLREVMGAVVAAADGQIAVLVKTNLHDGFDGGMTDEEGLAVARLLEQDGADALVLSGGFVSRAPMVIMRGAMPMEEMSRRIPEWWMRLLMRRFGPWLVPEVPYTDLYFLSAALRVRAAVRMPLVYVGGVATRVALDTALAHGFDAVAMARALIREPDFVQRLKREEDAQLGTTISRCTHCNVCAARIYTTTMACPLVATQP